MNISKFEFMIFINLKISFEKDAGDIKDQLNILRRLIGCGDAYPKDWSLKVEKGDYILKVHVRQEKRDLLDRYS